MFRFSWLPLVVKEIGSSCEYIVRRVLLLLRCMYQFLESSSMLTGHAIPQAGCEGLSVGPNGGKCPKVKIKY